MKSVKHKLTPKSTELPDPQVVEKLAGQVIEMPLPPLLRPHCGIWAEPGRVEIMFRLDTEGASYQHIVVEVPPKDGSLPVVRGRDAEAVPLFASVGQAAKLYGYKPKTFYNWIEDGKLTKEHGLLHFGREYRIELCRFKAAVARGELSSCF